LSVSVVLVIRARCPSIHLAFAENQLQDYLARGPLREPDEPKLIGSIFLVAGGRAEAARASIAAGPCIDSGFLSRDYREISHAGRRSLRGRVAPEVCRRSWRRSRILKTSESNE
jgi:hypothetical protein